MPIKFLLLGGGGRGFFGRGGWKCRFYFYGRGDFSDFMGYRAIIGPAPLQKCVGDFCCVNFGGFAGDFPGGFFLGTFSHKNEEKKSGEKICEKIRRPKNKNPRKIRSAKNRP